MKRLNKYTRFFMTFILIFALIISVAFNSGAGTSAEVEAKNLSSDTVNDEKSLKTASDTNTSAKKRGYFKLNVSAVLQYPELPTGCEVTALTTVLNYYGCDVDKTYLAKYYLEQGEIGETNPYDAFVGSPFSFDAYGCYSDVIVNAAQSYINDYGLNLNVKNVSELDFPQLLKYVKEGQPVIFWATMQLAKPYESTVWQIDGEEVSWIAYEHCMVLTGFDYDTDCYIVCDPLKGLTEYKRELMEVRYNQLGKHAVLICKGDGR